MRHARAVLVLGGQVRLDKGHKNGHKLYFQIYLTLHDGVSGSRKKTGCGRHPTSFCSSFESCLSIDVTYVQVGSRDNFYVLMSRFSSHEYSSNEIIIIMTNRKSSQVSFFCTMIPLIPPCMTLNEGCREVPR